MIAKCNCRDKVRCPLEGKCKQECVVYKVEVYSDPGNNGNKKVYFGSTQGEFKTRYYNHGTRVGDRDCLLCMEEKLAIASCKSRDMLNHRSEVLNSCRHKRAWLLYN